MVQRRWSSRFWLASAFLSFGMMSVLLAMVGRPLASSSAAVETAGWEDGVSSVSATAELSYTVALPLVARGYTPVRPSSFGVQMYGSLTESSQAMSLAHNAQVYWVRWPLAWSRVEPSDVSPENYRWATTDADITNLHASGQRAIATISSAPTWAAEYPQGPVDDAALADFAEFVGALAERYDGDGYEDAPGSPVVDQFEFFNEPDSTNVTAAEQGYGSYYGPYGARYAAMLCAANTSLKANNPSARVIMGGIAYDSFTTEGGSFNRAFLDDVMAAGGGACIDVMNFHYYPAFASTWNAYGNGLQGKATYLRDKLSQYGYGDMPMVVTEAGWHSDHYSDAYPGSPEIQSRYVVQLFTQAAAAHLESMIWWTWIDPGFPNGANGLLTVELEPKISYSVYRVAADRIGQAQFGGILQDVAGGEGYRFVTTSGLPMYVFWTNDGEQHTYQLPGAQARVVDMYGDVSTSISDSADGRSDGLVTVTLGTNPVYVDVLR